MGIYFDKRRKRYFVKIAYKNRFLTFYSDPKTGLPFLTKSEAKQCEPFLATNVNPASKAEDVKCEDLIKPFYNYLGSHLKASTVFSRSYIFENDILPGFRGLTVMKITNNDLDLINDQMNVQVAEGSRQNWCSCVHHWIMFLRKYNPSLLPERFFVKKSSLPEAHVYHIWTREEEAKFLSVIQNPTHKLLFTLVVDYGFRITELNALKWEDINFERNTISIQRTCCIKTFAKKQVFQSPKTKNSVRTLPLLTEVKALLPESRRKGYLFPGRVSTVSGENTIRKWNRSYAKKAGLKPLKMHEFRHSCASNLLKEGVPVRLVARWLGDTESSVLTYYSHLFGQEENTVADWMEKHPVNKTERP